MQESGKLIHDGELVAVGYSGFGAGKNNPRVQHIPNVGPVPVGRYEISRAFHSQADGVVCMHLTPKEGTNTYGRGGFLIHGESPSNDGDASRGCIVLSRPVRLLIDASEDRELEVA